MCSLGIWTTQKNPKLFMLLALIEQYIYIFFK